jgi:hypothetical protein
MPNTALALLDTVTEPAIAVETAGECPLPSRPEYLLGQARMAVEGRFDP